MYKVLFLVSLSLIFSCSSGSGGGGNEEPQQPSSSSVAETFTDPRDGQIYRIVTIGTQTWFAENLKYNVSGSKCYNNSQANCNKYGRLYFWFDVMDIDENCYFDTNDCPELIAKEHRGICPTGWHVPINNEWNELLNYVGVSTAATKLKAKYDWINNSTEFPLIQGTGDYGFTALPGGACTPSYGTCGSLGGATTWWTATMAGGMIYTKVITSGNAGFIETIAGLEHSMHSVRCLENVEKQETSSSSSDGNTFTDPRDNKSYPTVTLNGKRWFAQNLNYYASGSWCYNNSLDYCNATLGRYYTWSSAQGACPSGWHLPTNEEWEGLIDFAGGNEVAGKELKSKTEWNGTDNYGFSAIAGGFGTNSNNSGWSFTDFRFSGSWWTSTDMSGYKVFYSMNVYSESVTKSMDDDAGMPSELALSVRCVED